jgi:hypothetical protein
MRRWKLLVAVVGMAVLAAGAFVLWSYPWPNGVTRENWDQIELGMNLEELEALLGPHLEESQLRLNDISYTGEWAQQGDLKIPEYVDDPGYPGEFHIWVWRGPAGLIMVRHDALPRAIGKIWVPRLGTFERLRRQWRSRFR